MEPTFWDRLATELRLVLASRRSEVAVFAVALLMGSVFVTVRLLETSPGLPSQAQGPTQQPPLLTPTTLPTQQQTTPAIFREEAGFGGLELSPLPTQPPLSVTPTPTLTPTPTGVTMPNELSPTSTPSPTPRLNPFAPYLP